MDFEITRVDCNCSFVKSLYSAMASSFDLRTMLQDRDNARYDHIITQKPKREKKYLLTCAPNENPNQSAHACSLKSLCCPHEETLHPRLSKMQPLKILNICWAHMCAQQIFKIFNGCSLTLRLTEFYIQDTVHTFNIGTSQLTT